MARGFSVTDGIADLWVDTYLWMLSDDVSANHDEDELIGASKYLQGQTGPVCVSDNIIADGGIRERRTTVAYKDAFYTVSYSYPISWLAHYQPYETPFLTIFLC